MSVPRRLGIGSGYSPDVSGGSRSVQSSRALLQQKLSDNGMPIATDCQDANTIPSSPNSRPSSPGGYNSNLYSPKPSPGVRVNVASPAPSSGSAPPASYTVLPGLDRSHRYVITGTLQQSLFGVVKLAFDRQLRLQVAIKISRRERAQQQQTRSGVSVLENVRREAAVMRYMHERSASAAGAHASAEGLSRLALHNASEFADNGSGKKVKLSSRALQHVKAQEEEKRRSITGSSNKPDGMMEDDETLKKETPPSSVPAQAGHAIESDTDSNHESDSDCENDTRMISPATPNTGDGSDHEGEKYLCKFIEELEDEYFHYLISEFVPAGDLYSMLTSYPQHRLAEGQARGLFRQMVLGTKYLHERNVAHLDMSLENMCLTGDHRVLTRSGWKSITRMQVGDVVLSFNKETYAQEWKAIRAVTSHAVDPDREEDTLYRMQGSGMDVIATRDHRMLLARLSRSRNATEDGLQSGKPVDYETVGELLELTYAPSARSKVTSFAHSSVRHVVCAGLNRQPGVKIVIPGLEQVCDWWWDRDGQLGFLRFLGFWLGDGYLSVWHGLVCINQKKEQANQWLEQHVLPHVFPGWWYRSAQLTRPGHYIYTIRCPPLYNYLRVMAVGPIGYNPRDPTQLRSYPHFTKDEELAAMEQQSDYYQDNNNRDRASTWTQAAMLAAMRGDGVAAMDEVKNDAAASTALDNDARRSSFSAATTESSTRLSASDERRFSFSGYSLNCGGTRIAPEDLCEVISCMLCGERESMYLDPDSAVGQWRCADCEGAKEGEKEGKESPASRQPVDIDAPALEEGGDGAQIPLAAAIDAGQAQAMQVAGKIVWHNDGLFIVIDGHWFYLKRWLGERNVANVYSQLSRQQAVALLDGFCRADGRWSSIQYEESGEPTGCWHCCNSSFPLIDHLMLIGQLAGAAVDLQLHTKAGKTSEIDGRNVNFSVDHWLLLFSFTKSVRGIPMQTAPFAQPVDVSDDMDGRGYYQYTDDKKVYCITVEGNANFLTQRLSNKRLESGDIGVKAHSVFVGNCLDSDDTIRIIDFGVAAIHPFTPTTYASATAYFTFPSASTPLPAQRPVAPTASGTPLRSFVCKPVKELYAKPGKIRYMSPELFQGLPWDAYANDVFSLGVILYSLLTGRPPFQQAESSDVWFHVIYSGQWLTPQIRKQPSAHVYTHLSESALDLVNRILKPQEVRPTCEQILQHPWMLQTS